MSIKSITNTYIYVLLLTLLQAFRFLGEESEKPIFIITNILFTLFISFKIYSLRHEKRILLNPLLLASLKMFLLAYGATIFYVYSGNIPLIQYIEVSDPYEYLNNGMIYASIGFITMWHSYNSNLVKRAAITFLNLTTKQKMFLRKDLEPRWFFVYVIFFSSIAFKLLLISLGVYGVIGTLLAENIEIPYLQYIEVLSSAGSGALLFLYIYFFKTGKKKSLFIIFFSIDFFFAIITGFKGAIVMCIVVLAIAYYIVNEKMKFSYILITIFTIIFAYAIVTPYRYYLETSTSFDKYSITSIVNGFISSNKASKQRESESDKLAVIKRFNFIPELTKFQEYKTEHGLKHDDPDFLYITLTAPIQIFVPRLLWKEKPKADLGRLWVTQKVLGRNNNSSTAFGPIGFLYLTGGILAIVLGFFIVAFFLQLVNQFHLSGYWGGIIIMLALLYNTISLEAQFNFYIIIFIQTLLLSILFQYILIKKSK